jgi:RecB family exonuclease
MAAGLDHCRLPVPQPLAYTTPSGAATLADCRLRTAYDSDSSSRSRVTSSPAARLGTVCHRVLELVGAGELPAAHDPRWRQAFEAAWSAALSEQEQERQLNPLEAHWPPPERWPYYAARKVATRRLCERMSESANGPSSSGGRAAEPAPEKLQEQRQQAFGGKLRGRADVIRRSPEPEIEDYKTGSLFEAGTDEVKPTYRRQMLLYAVLEHEATGVWPKSATLVPLQGERISIEINPDEASAAAEEALRALDEYNSAVDRGVDAIDLAAPSPSACRFCPYAIECPAFWLSAGPLWLQEGIVALAGELLGREESRLSTFNLRVRREGGTVGPGEYLLYQLDAERFGALLGIPLETEIAAVWLVGVPEAAHFKAGSRTQIAVGNAEERGD